MATSGVKFFQYTNDTPSTVWTIFHGFGSMPLVDCAIDDGGVMKKAFPQSVIQIDENNVQITWSTPRAGFAVLASTLA